MTTPANPVAAHRWKFFRAGGLDQVLFENGADLTDLASLDQKLWIALSCPTKGLEFDSKTLELIDADKDGRIRAPELIAAIQWAAARLKSADVLLRPGDGLPLEAIDDSTPAGRMLANAAKEIRRNLGRATSPVLTVADTSNTAKIFAEMRCNGDGVVTAASTNDAALQQLIGEIIDCLGGDADRSGKPGVGKARVEQFYAALKSYADWWAAGEAHAKAGTTVLPLGADTPAAAAAVKAVRAKIDDYFARCRLAAYDPRAAAHLNRPDSEYATLAAKDLSTPATEIAALPLAQVAAGKPLPLTDGVNPAWTAAVAAFRDTAVKPLLGNLASLDETQWRELAGRFAAYDAWAGSKQGAAVEKLGLARIRELLAGDGAAKLAQLIEEDLAVAPEIAAIDDLDRLARYHRDLAKLVNNFVSFTDFYSPTELAIFQAGTLYLDSRSCELCIEVADPGAHSALAALSKCYIAYCDLKRPGGQTRKIAAIFSNGDSDYLMVGRNGIFYDRKGLDWDATIVKVIENPISIRQAFFSPYKKFVRMVEDQIAKRAAAAEASSQGKLAAAAESTANVDKAGGAAAPKKIDVGTVAAIGVAFGAIGTFLGTIFAALMGLGPWLPIGLLGIILLISGPSMLIAWLKLRQRTLGPVLEANGWAINGRVKINIPLGTKLTEVARLPKNAQRTLDDPYEDKQGRARRRRIIFWLIVLAVTAVAIRVHHSYFNDGYYFWQRKPVPEAAPAAEARPAPTAPAEAPPPPAG